ncbi:MAG: malectin domain-containing carbohydrate-binding protein, partial [Bacteroidota bacterium]
VDQSSTPTSIFNSERWDQTGGSEMKYSFPVSQSGTYEVRLYMGNGCGCTQSPGDRIFSVSIEGSVPSNLQNIDLSSTYGHLVGAMVSYNVSVSDGSIDIEFLHNTENPLINGIEILGGSGGGPPTSNPIVLNNIGNQSSQEGANISLAVQASGGDGALVYSANGLPPGLSINSGNGVISGTITSGANNNSPYAVSVSVDDSDSDNSDIKSTSFSWTVLDPNSGPPTNVLYRVNAGGPATTSIDSPNPDWEVDDLKNTVTQYHNASSYTSNHNVPNRDGTVPSSVPQSIFGTERWDHSHGDEMKWFFDVDPGTYEVRLFFANGFNGTSQPGQRVFNVELEGSPILTNFDLVAEVGHQVGTMKTYTITVNDGTINIDFYRITGDPIINGVEILGSGGGSPSTPISLSPIQDQVDEEGDNANVTVTASGGDGNLQYSANNLPPGVSIDPTNGLIGGTIQAGASANSPYTVNITVDDSDADNSDVQSTSFTWTINAPSQSNPISLTPIPNQNNTEGDNIGLAVQASGGDGTLTYSASGLPTGLSINSNTGLISGTIASGASNNSPYLATVTVDDSDGDNTDTQSASFSWVVNGNGGGGGPTTGILYRVNTGGPSIAAIDGGIAWGEDSNPNPSQYLVSGSPTTSGFSMQSYDPSVNQSTTPTSIFNTERWDQSTGDEMKYAFPVSQAGNYEVRLYMGNGYSGTQSPGTRVFSVSVEGTVPSSLANIDLSGTYGHQVGAMISYTVAVSDGNIDIEFLHNVENPLVNGIEILGSGGTPPPPPGNTAPVALMSATPTSGTAPLVVSFDASPSFDSDNDPLSYSWNFGDGNSGSGLNPSHTYQNAGTYTATLTVNDGNGGTDQTSEQIVVNNAGNPCNGGSVTYLSDLNWTSVSNQFGNPKKDKNHNNGTLTIGGQTYTKGLGAHANSEIVYNLGGQYESFKSDIGVDDGTCNTGSIIFRVLADGNLIYESPVLKQVDNVVSIDLNVSGVNQLTLIADKSVSNFWCDHANWADARLESNCSSSRQGGNTSSFAPSFTLYPNPTQSGRFLIEADMPALTEDIEVEIWNMNGSLVKTQSFSSPSMKMNIGENAPDGIYLVKVRYQDNWNSYRILKMK